MPREAHRTVPELKATWKVPERNVLRVLVRRSALQLHCNLLVTSEEEKLPAK